MKNYMRNDSEPEVILMNRMPRIILMNHAKTYNKKNQYNAIYLQHALNNPFVIEK